MNTTNTIYDRQFNSGVPTYGYMKGTSSQITPYKTSRNLITRDYSFYKPSTSVPTTEQQVDRGSLLQLPFISPESIGKGKGETLQFNQDNMQTGWQNFTDSLISNVKKLKQDRDKFDIVALEEKIKENKKQLESGVNTKTGAALTKDEVYNLRYEISSSTKELEDLYKGVKDRNSSLSDYQADIIYQIKAMQAQEDEQTGMPFSKMSKYGFVEGLGKYFKYELPQDLAGNFTTIWASIISASPAIAERIIPMALEAAGTPAPGARWAAAAITVGGIIAAIAAQFKARQNESKMEAGSAYTERLEKLMTEYFTTTGDMPEGEDLENLKTQAYKGMKQVYDANMALYAEDIVQTALLALPWSKTIRNSFGLFKYGTAATGIAGLAVNSWMEGKEEGYQFIVQDQYKRGEIPEDTASIGYWWDTTTETAKAMFGIGDPRYMNDKEFRNSVRAGKFMGFLMDAPISLAGDINSIRKFSKDERGIRDLLSTVIDTEQDNYRHSIYSKAVKNGTQDRAIGILEGLKDSEFARENDLSSDRIDEEIAYAKKTFAAYKYANSGKLGRELTDNDKKKLVSAIVNTSSNIEQASNNIEENETYINDIYDNVQEILNNSEPELKHLNRLNNRIAAINAKLEILEENKDQAIGGINKYKKYLYLQLSKAAVDFELGMENSKLTMKDLVLPSDESVVHFEALNLDNEFQILTNKELFTRLSIQDNAIKFINEGNNKSDIVDEVKQEKAKEEAIETNDNSDEIRVKDSTNNQLTYLGKTADGRYEFLNKTTKQIETLTSGEVNERTLVEETTGQPITKEPTVLLDKEGNEYLYLGKTSKGDIKIKNLDNYDVVIVPKDSLKASDLKAANGIDVSEWVPGIIEDLISSPNENYIKLKEEQKKNEAEIEKAEKSFKEKKENSIKETVFNNSGSEQDKLLNGYVNNDLSNLTFAELFGDNPIIGYVPVIYNDIIGIMKLSPDDSILFETIDGVTKIIGDLTYGLKMKDYNIKVLKNFIFNFEVSQSGDVLKIEDNEYTLDRTNPTKAIVEDGEGNPIKVKLTRKSTGKTVTFTNKTVVHELSAYIMLVEEVKNEVLDSLKTQGEDFVKIVNPESEYGKEYYVYSRDGEYVVMDPEPKNMVQLNHNSAAYGVIMSEFNKALNSIIDSISDSFIDFNESNKNIKNSIQDEIRRISEIIRPATAEEVLDAKSAAELQNVKTSKDKKTGQTDEQEIITEEEKKLINNKAEDLAEEVVEYEKNVIGDNISSQTNIEDIPVEVVAYEDEIIKANRDAEMSGLADVASSIGWTANDNIEFDNYISDSKLDITGAYGNLEIDFEYDDFWSMHPGLKENILSGNKIDLTPSNPDFFDDIIGNNIVDSLPLKITLYDKNGNVMPGASNLYYHNSGYNNIKIPEGITDPVQYVINHKRHVRATRVDIINNILKGNEVSLVNLKRFKGKLNTEPSKIVNRNKNLRKIFKNTKNFILGVADTSGVIRISNNKGIGKFGSEGNVFLITDETLDGSTFNLKLNPVKLSREHAEILFNSMVTAYSGTKGGYSAKYPISGVSNLTVGEIIKTLVLEGEMTIQSLRNNPKEHLIPKQLYGKNRVIYYGENNAINTSSYTEAEKEAFIKWAMENKNYNINKSLLGTTLQKNIKIGNLSADKGQLYDNYIVDSSLVLTDLKEGRPFHAPVIGFDLYINTPIDEVVSSIETEKTNKEVLKKREEQLSNIENTPEVKSITNKILELENNIESLKKDLETTDNKDQVSSSIGDAITELDSLNNEKQVVIEDMSNKITDSTIPTPTISEIPEDYDILNNIGSDLAPFRLRDYAPNKFVPINLEDEIKWLSKTLPNLNIEVIEDYIKVHDKLAFGFLNNYGITLFKGAEKGTVYHEAFHYVSLGLLSDLERDNIYNEARTKYNLENKTDSQVEEVLAEKFREFVLFTNKDTYKTNTSIKAFFKRLFNLLYTFFTGNKPVTETSIKRLFEAINNKEYKYTNKVNNITDTYTRLQSRDRIKQITGFTTDNINEVVNNLQYLVFTLNDINNIDNISNLNFDIVLSKLETLKDEYSIVLSKLADDDKRKPEISRLNEVYSAIIDNFSDFKKLTEDRLKALKIYKREENPNDIEFTKGKGLTGFDKYIMESYEFSAKENMLTSIKMLVMTLPESKDRSRFTNLFKFVDYESFFNKLLYDMHNLNNIDSMLDKLSKKSDTTFAYSVLYNKLKGNELLKTQFEVSLKKVRHRFVNLLYVMEKNKPVFSFVDADVQNASRAYINSWGHKFATSDLFNVKGELSKEKVVDLFNRYGVLLKEYTTQFTNFGKLNNLADALESIAGLLNEISIDIDSNILNSIIADKEDIQSLDEGFIDFITNDINNLFSTNSILYEKAEKGKIKRKGSEVDNTSLFRYETQIRNLSNKVPYVVPENMTVTVLGPGGNPYYIYSQNSYVSDVVSKINNDSDNEYINYLLSATYNKNSYILNQLKNSDTAKKNFHVNTFSGFIQLNEGDTGRNYLEISDIEDFLLKFSAVHDGYKVNNLKKGKLIMPTLADRKTYQMYSGIDILDMKFDVNKNNDLIFPLDSEVVTLFSKYLIDEHNRVELIKKQIDEAVKAGDTTRLVANLHYQNASDTKRAKVYEKVDRGVYKIFVDKNGKYVGNGTKYTYFSQFNDIKLDINDPKQVRAAAIGLIVSNTRDTIKYMSELGIVTTKIDASGVERVADNVLLDDYLISHVANEEFGGNKIHAINKLISNYTVNFMMSIIETEKLLMSDPANYKNVEDKVKRLTALISTGDNLRIDFPAGHEFHGRSTFTSSTLNTDEIKSTYYDAIKLKYVELLMSQGYPENEANRIANHKVSAYIGINQTDGQVYISPSMYRELSIRAGEWSRDKQNAFDLLSDNKFLEPSEELTALNIIMSPLKMVYFGQHVSDNIGVAIYDKMSLAPLFRRIVDGTDLQDLLDRMETKGKYKNKTQKIDYIKFDSAVKVGERHKYNYYKDRERTTIKDFNEEDLVIEYQDFDKLRRQQIVEPHDDYRTFLGTQVKKVAMANVDKEGTYSLGSGNEVLNNINSTLSKLSNIHKETLLNRLGVDPSTNTLTDVSKLYTLLYSEMEKSGTSDNILNALSLDESGEIFLHIDSIPNRKEIENRLVSIIDKHTVDLEVPGKSLVQITNFGIDNNLKFYRFENGKTQPMECIVSVSLFKDIIPDYNNKTWKEKREFIKKLRPELMGYRIPTQGQNSVPYMVVADVLPEQMGDTIILPSEFTSLTGSDFDIDKLYVYRYNYDVLDDESVVKVTDDNTLRGLENKLLDNYISILSDEKHYLQVITPLDAATKVLYDKKNKSGIVFDIRELEGKEGKYDWNGYELSPRYQADVKAAYTGGKGGIGPFALNNVHHVLGQMVGLKYITNIGVGHIDEYNNTDLSRAKDAYKTNGEYIYITDWLSALINAHVDIAKDPWIYDLNVNSNTYSLVNLLIRAGVGENTFYFITQPILKEYSREADLQKGTIRGIVGRPFDIIKTRWEEKMVNASKGINVDKKTRSNDPIWDKERLRKDINKNTERDVDFYSRQLQILDAFSRLNSNAFELNELVLVSRIDNKGYGKNIMEIKTFLNKLNKVKDNNMFIGMPELFNNTFLGTLYDNSIVLINDMLKGLTISSSESVLKVHDYILEQLGKKYNADTVLINNIADELFSMISYNFFKNNTRLQINDSLYKDMIYGDNTTAKKLNDYKVDDRVKNNRLINTLVTNNITDDESPDTIISYNSQIKDKWDRDDITSAWEDLLYHKDEDIRNFAEELVKYAFISSGFKRNIFSFFQYIPVTFMKEIGYDSFIKDQLDIFNDDNSSLLLDKLNSFYRHNWANDDIVPKVRWADLKDALDDPSTKTMGIFKVKGKSCKTSSGTYSMILGVDKNFNFIYRPYIKVIGFDNLYRYVGQVRDENRLIPVYVVDIKQGYNSKGITFKEYGSDTSVFNGNLPNISTETANKLSEENIHIIGSTGKYSSFISKNTFALIDNNKYMLTTDINTNATTIREIKEKIGGMQYDLLVDLMREDPYINMTDNDISMKLKNEDNILLSESEINIIRKENNIEFTPSGLAEFTREQNERLFEEQVAEINNNKSIKFEEEQSFGYRNRTIKNASADATIAIAVDFNSAGEKLTKSSVLNQNKKYIPIDANKLEVTQERVDKIVEQLNSIDKKITSTANIPQNLVSGIEAFGTKQEANSKAKELLGNSPHSIDMIEAGIRTRTTRSVGEMQKYNIKVGDVVTQFGKSSDGTTKQILTKITAIHPEGTPGFLETWEKEGWTKEGVKAIERFKDGAAAIEFEIFKPSITLNIAGNGIYTMKGKYTQQQVDDFTYELLKAVIESPNLKNKIESIRTGGQTGFDEAGAKAGIKLGIPTTILAPKGWTFRDITGKDISDEQQFKARFNEKQINESPFLSDEEIFASGVGDVIFSTEATPEKLAELREKYKHCK